MQNNLYKATLYFEWLSFEEELEKRPIGTAYWSEEKKKSFLDINEKAFHKDFFTPITDFSFNIFLKILKELIEDFTKISSIEEYFEKINSPTENWEGFFFGSINKNTEEIKK